MLGHSSIPLGQFLIAAIEAQAQREAHWTTHIQARDRVMRQGKGAITVVIVPVHIIEEASHVFAKRIINDHERLAAAVTMGGGLLEHKPDTAAIDLALPPWGL